MDLLSLGKDWGRCRAAELDFFIPMVRITVTVSNTGSAALSPVCSAQPRAGQLMALEHHIPQSAEHTDAHVGQV